MAELKTAQNAGSVEDYLSSIEPAQRQQDSRALSAMMQGVVGAPPSLWGSSIVGFGSYHYVYASGREGDWMLTGFAARKSALTVYIMDGFEAHADLLQALGPDKTGRSCLYLKSLDAIDRDVLQQIIAASVKNMREKYG